MSLGHFMSFSSESMPLKILNLLCYSTDVKPSIFSSHGPLPSPNLGIGVSSPQTCHEWPRIAALDLCQRDFFPSPVTSRGHFFDNVM